MSKDAKISTTSAVAQHPLIESVVGHLVASLPNRLVLYVTHPSVYTCRSAFIV